VSIDPALIDCLHSRADSTGNVKDAGAVSSYSVKGGRRRLQGAATALAAGFMVQGRHLAQATFGSAGGPC
jgi:hypothetical protein